MERYRALALAYDRANARGRPVGVLKDGNIYKVEPNIEELRFLPKELVAIFWPGGKTLLNARPKNFDERAASMRAGTENEWVCEC